MEDAVEPVAVRVGDADRRTVDGRLQQAVGDGLLTLGEYDERAALVWQARTRADLEAVTRDLPGTAPAPVPGAAPPASRTRRVLAVMSGDSLHGPVAPGQGVEAYAVMGEAVLDLRRPDLPAQVHVRATAVMGSVQVLVPRGTSVQLSGMSVMGARELRLDPPRPGAPVVDLTAYAVMGAVEVTHGKDAPDGGDRSAVDLHKPGAPASVSSHAAGQHPPGVMAGHSVRVAEGRTRRPHRGRLLLAAGALGLAGAVGFQVTGQDASAVFGSSTLHVRSGRTVHVGAMFGSVKVVVPDNAQVDTSGGMVFGSMQCESACGPKSDAPYSITIDGKGAFGSIEVVTESEAGRSDSEGHSGSHDAG